MCNIHPHRMPAERVHLMDNNKSHYTAEYRRHTYTDTNTYLHKHTLPHSHLFIIFVDSLILSTGCQATITRGLCMLHATLTRCHADPRSLYSLTLPLLPLLIMLMSFWIVSLSYQQPHLAMWAIIIIIMKKFCSSLYLPFLLYLSLSLSSFFSAPLLLFSFFCLLFFHFRPCILGKCGLRGRTPFMLLQHALCLCLCNGRWH